MHDPAGVKPEAVIAYLTGLPRQITPQKPPDTAPGFTRVHLFCGDFLDPHAAGHYAFHADANGPSALEGDLPYCYLDLTFVEVRHGDVEPRLDEFLDDDDLADVISRMAGANTLVIIAEPAFSDLAYALHDTSRLRYLGPLVVAV